MAESLCKGAALWLPAGTMAKQAALRGLTRPGDEGLTSRECHADWHELRGAVANTAVPIHEGGQGGLFIADKLQAAARPLNFAIFPSTTLVQIENTHHRAGGVVVPQPVVLELCAVARELGGDHPHGQCRSLLDGRTATRLR